MKKICYLILLAFAGCHTKKTNDASIYLTNESDVDSVINVKTFVNGNFYKAMPVKRKFKGIPFETFDVELPLNVDSINLTFVISGTKDSTSCVIDRKKWRDNDSCLSWISVRFNETVLKKGSEYLGQVLSRDTIVDRKFCANIETGYSQ